SFHDWPIPRQPLSADRLQLCIGSQISLVEYQQISSAYLGSRQLRILIFEIAQRGWVDNRSHTVEPYHRAQFRIAESANDAGWLGYAAALDQDVIRCWFTCGQHADLVDQLALHRAADAAIG